VCRPDAKIFLAGLATTALLVLLAAPLDLYDGLRLYVRGLWFLPLGALGLGVLGGSGYGFAAWWWTRQRFTVGVLLAIAVMAGVAYWLVTWVGAREVAPHLGFGEYLDWIRVIDPGPARGMEMLSFMGGYLLGTMAPQIIFQPHTLAKAEKTLESAWERPKRRRPTTGGQAAAQAKPAGGWRVVSKRAPIKVDPPASGVYLAAAVGVGETNFLPILPEGSSLPAQKTVRFAGSGTFSAHIRLSSGGAGARSLRRITAESVDGAEVELTLAVDEAGNPLVSASTGDGRALEVKVTKSGDTQCPIKGADSDGEPGVWVIS